MVKSRYKVVVIKATDEHKFFIFPFSDTLQIQISRRMCHMPRSCRRAPDIFFYNELCSTLGHVRAEHWLANDASSSTVSGSFGDENEQGEKVGLSFADEANQLLDSPRSVASTCSSCSSLLSINPQRSLPTLADFFFYNELRSTLGHVLAEHWLASAASPCIPSRPASQAGWANQETGQGVHKSAQHSAPPTGRTRPRKPARPNLTTGGVSRMANAILHG